MKYFLQAVAVLTVSFALAGEGQTLLYVDAQKGADATGDGTAAKPFASLEKARQSVRDMKKGNVFPKQGVIVECAGMFAYPQKTFDLGKNDGGLSEEARVTYRAAKGGALFVGGYALPQGGFKKLEDAATLQRLQEAARGKVYVFDLKTVGVPELKPLPVQFDGWSEMEIFSGGRAMRIARWPNTGWTVIDKVIDRGVKPVDHATGEWENGVRGGTFAYAEDEPARWNIEKGVWLNGFWCWDWSNESMKIAKLDKTTKQITTAGIHTYGVGCPGKRRRATAAGTRSTCWKSLTSRANGISTARTACFISTPWTGSWTMFSCRIRRGPSSVCRTRHT